MENYLNNMKYQISWKQAKQSKTNPNKNLCYYVLFGVLAVAFSCIFIQIDGLSKDSEPNINFPNFDKQVWFDNAFKSAGIDPKFAYKVMMCESKGNLSATHYNGKYGVDRGIFQISNLYHKEVSNACAYNYHCSIQETIRIVKQYGWKQWACYKLVK